MTVDENFDREKVETFVRDVEAMIRSMVVGDREAGRAPSQCLYDIVSAFPALAVAFNHFTNWERANACYKLGAVMQALFVDLGHAFKECARQEDAARADAEPLAGEGGGN